LNNLLIYFSLEPKKLAFSISALVGEDSESEIEETEVEHEVVDVVSDQVNINFKVQNAIFEKMRQFYQYRARPIC
jgi:hypothetical protein